MIDRFGKHIFIYFADHEILWIEAANHLDYHERQAAFRDIAELSGRHLNDVRKKAHRLKRVQKEAAAKALAPAPKPKPVWILPPSQLKPPSMARLMGCR